MTPPDARLGVVVVVVVAVGVAQHVRDGKARHDVVHDLRTIGWVGMGMVAVAVTDGSGGVRIAVSAVGRPPRHSVPVRRVRAAIFTACLACQTMLATDPA